MNTDADNLPTGDPNTVGPDPDATRPKDPRLHPFRRALLRGLAVLLPPLLTIVIFIWVWNTLREYVLIPVETGITNVAIWSYYDNEIHVVDPDPIGNRYVQLDDGKWIPREIRDRVAADPGADIMPNTAVGVYRRYIQIRWLPWYAVGPVFICALLIVLSFVGRFLAAGMGRYFWNTFDRLLHQLPIVRNVYGAVKQVTDFVFSEREIEFNRVVAVEYPRKGIWSIGFVTGESMADIHGAANEPIVSVLMPTSPMPATGFTINVKKSETIDLNITIDQAIQFIVSCGVVIPAQQLVKPLAPPTADTSGPLDGNGSPTGTAGGTVAARRRENSQ